MSSDASEALAPGLGPVSRYAFEQLDAPAAGIRSEADLLADAWAQSEQIREQARRTGEAEGHAAGLAAARAEVESALGALAEAVAWVEQMIQELTSALEHDAAALAFQICEQILAGALDVQPERVVDVARNALRRVNERRRVVLVVNPADLEVMGDAVQTLQAELGGIEHCDVQSDRRVGAGGAILRTDAGEIDATLETELVRARDIVAEALRGRPDAS